MRYEGSTKETTKKKSRVDEKTKGWGVGPLEVWADMKNSEAGRG